MGSAFLLKNAKSNSSFIKSIQNVSISCYGVTGTAFNATINAVDIDNSIIIWNGIVVTASPAYYNYTLGFVILFDSTTVTFYRYASSSTYGSTINVLIVEFYPDVVKSKQYGTTIINANGTSSTTTITAVNTDKTLLTYCGSDCRVASSTSSKSFTRVELTNSTTVTAIRQAASTDAPRVSWNLIEFK